MKLEDMFRYRETGRIDDLDGTLKDLKICVREIRAELGDKSHLLSEYMLGMFEIQNRINESTVAATECEEAESDLRGLCDCIMEGGGADHPFYSQLVQIIRDNPCPSNKAYRDYYSALARTAYTRFILEAHENTRKTMFAEIMAEYNMAALEVEMEKNLAPAKLDGLRDLFHKRFIIVQPSDMLMQNMADRLVYNCLTQDKHKTRYVFQMLFDGE